MTQAKVLFDDVSFFRNLFISFYFVFGQFRRLGVFSHYAIFDVVKGQKVPVGFTGIPFVGKYFLDGLFGVTAVDSTVWEVVGIVNGSRRQCCRKYKTIVDINSRMFFEPVMDDIFLNNPVGIQVPMEFKWIAVFIELAFRCIVFFSCLLILSLLMGRLADLTSLASTAMPSFIVRPWFSN